jgi:hypothetical protein
MEFLAADIERILEVKRNRLQQWLERGYIIPSIQVASGHGTRNVWSRNDLYTIALFKKITESGLSRKLVSDFLSAGSIGSDSVDNIYCILYMRCGGKVKGMTVPFLTKFTANGKPILELDFNSTIKDAGLLNIPVIQKELFDEVFDDIYIINFLKLRCEIDEKIETG